MKTFLVIGLGRFGAAAAEKLYSMGHEVLIIDEDEELVRRLADQSTHAVVGDAQDMAVLRAAGAKECGCAIVAIGDDFQSSLETTALLKEQGAPFVVSRANRDVHAKFLLRNGADDVIYPEKQMASWAAVRYTADHVFDYVELTPEHSIFETAVPASWVGKTVVELAVRQKYRINILATKHDGKLEPLPGPNHTFLADETIFILGDNKDVQKFLHF